MHTHRESSYTQGAGRGRGTLAEPHFLADASKRVQGLSSETIRGPGDRADDMHDAVSTRQRLPVKILQEDGFGRGRQVGPTAKLVGPTYLCLARYGRHARPR
jgi:hypothetical protein